MASLQGLFFLGIDLLVAPIITKLLPAVPHFYNLNCEVVHTLIYKHTDAEGGQSLTGMNTPFMQSTCGRSYYLVPESIHTLEAGVTMKTITQDYIQNGTWKRNTEKSQILHATATLLCEATMRSSEVIINLTWLKTRHNRIPKLH